MLGEELNRMLEPSTSGWSSPVILIPKIDRSRRFCVDYRSADSMSSLKKITYQQLKYQVWLLESAYKPIYSCPEERYVVSSKGWHLHLAELE